MKRPIFEINSARCKNKTHAQFLEVIRSIVQKTGAALLGIEELFILFLNALANELECLDIITKSELTAQITEQDAVRDSLFRGLWDAVKSFRNHFDAEYRVAANLLWNILLHNGNVAKLSLDEQTAAIIMAIVSEESGIPLERLFFRSIKLID